VVCGWLWSGWLVSAKETCPRRCNLSVHLRTGGAIPGALLESTLDGLRFDLNTELQSLLRRLSSVEPSPWLSDGLYRAAAAAAASLQQPDYLEQLLPSFHLDQFSSLRSIPAPNRLKPQWFC